MFSAIKRFFSKALRKFWGIIRKIFNGALEVFLAEFMDFALETVRDLANTDLSNDDKRKNAFNEIKNKAIMRGVEWKDSYVNLLLEICVAKIKKEF